jgi:transcriptional regulator with XRE-family HTH domain
VVYLPRCSRSVADTCPVASAAQHITMPTPAPFQARLAEHLKVLGRRIREMREFRRLSLQALAQQADIGVQTLIRIEDGSPGAGALNVSKVLHVLGMPSTLVPIEGSVPLTLPCHAMHVDSPDVDDALEAATSSACKTLDVLLGVKRPEVDGISSNFQGQLKAHLAAMLCGKPGATHSGNLKRLVYSDDFVGGPRYAPPAEVAGWALRLRGEPRVLQDFRWLRLGDLEFDPFVDRAAALESFRAYVETAGHPPGPVDAVPVFRDGEQYKF